MKQLTVEVRSDSVEEVVRLADEYRAFAASHHAVKVQGEEGWSRVLVNVPNEEVGPFVAAVGEAVDEAEFVIPTSENVPVRTPIEDVRDRVADVSSRSTLELVLSVLQSVGSWQGMLLYAVVSGVVAAYGVIFNLPFLLTAAMLIAPFGAPAMVCVVGVAVGDPWMVRRGGVRFVVSLVVLAVSAALLGFAYGLTHSTEMMETLTSLSLWTGLLGVAGGAAGAQALIQAERDSLVTATATGFLVAVSLSPPSAVLGLAVALGRWGYVGLMAFVVTLTLFGIIFGGWAALRYQGVRPGKPSANRGSSSMAWIMVAAVAVVLAGLVFWQTQQGPTFSKADRARLATQRVHDAVAEVGGYNLLLADARFSPTRSEGRSEEALVLSVTVTEVADTSAEVGAGVTSLPADSAKDILRSAIRRHVEEGISGVRPYVELSILP